MSQSLGGDCYYVVKHRAPKAVVESKKDEGRAAVIKERASIHDEHEGSSTS